MSLLETQALTVRYGGLAANADIDIKVDQGRLVGLIGPNGAGKTTFIDAITGFTAPSSGSVLFDGNDVTHLTPTRRAAVGLCRTFQSLELFEDLSVRDNLLVAADRPPMYPLARWFGGKARTVRAAQQADHSMRTLEISHLAEIMPVDLSHGQRKLVCVARAMAAQPKLLLLDEPAAGLDTTESGLLGERLRSFLDDGITIFLIDHDMGLVLNVCDYIYVLDFGRIIASGTPTEVRVNPVVVAAYLGEKAGEEQARHGPRAHAPSASPIDSALQS